MLGVVICNISKIFYYINSTLDLKFGIRIYALDKYDFYLKKGDILNGRGVLWKEAVNLIKENPIFGKGIGYFESQVSTHIYIHNILLQAMCEGGLCSLLPVLFLIFICIGMCLDISDKRAKIEYLFFTWIFSYGVIMLFYSSTYWKYAPFWFLCGYVVKKIKKDKLRIRI